MAIQPGVGFSFTSSSHGTTLDINQPYTDPAPFVPPEQFEVLVSGNNVFTCKGRVITQDVWAGTGLDATSAEYDLTGIWAYPTGSKTTGSNASSPWADSEGFITIANAAAEGSDSWGVYIVRQPLNKGSNNRSPSLVVIADYYLTPSDAYEKTTPWGEADTTDSIRLYGGLGATAVEIDGTPSGYLISGFDPDPVQYNYNCQRVKVASIAWNGTTNSWDVTQQLIGTITLPNIIQYYGIQLVVAGSTSPFATWPQYETECDAWNGAWTGYSKPSMQTSVILPVGMPG
jgi:hypothetical protein